MQILSFLYFSSFISKENQILNEEDNLHKIFVILEEEINHIDIDFLPLKNVAAEKCKKILLEIQAYVLVRLIKTGRLMNILKIVFYGESY